MKPAVDTAQTTWELEQLLSVVPDVERVLEVGIWEGGTLWHWLKLASLVVGIDDTMRDPGPTAWNAWADGAGSSLALLHGSSRDEAVVAQAREFGPYDFVFIDADHSYASVRSDWDTYRPMVAPGGVVAFHDITPRPDYGVDQLWGEVKAEPGSRTLEIVENSGRFNGIGVVWL